MFFPPWNVFQMLPAFAQGENDGFTIHRLMEFEGPIRMSYRCGLHETTSLDKPRIGEKVR
jgi:hypothetical protein